LPGEPDRGGAPESSEGPAVAADPREPDHQPAAILRPRDLPEPLPRVALAAAAAETKPRPGRDLSPALRRAINTTMLTVVVLGVVGTLFLYRAPDARVSRAPEASRGPGSAAAPPPATEAKPGEDPLERATYYLARAKTGDADAQYRLAMIYANGIRPNQDLARAVVWFGKAAAAGVVDAQYNLATLYDRGFGVPQDLNEALKWYRSAADHDHPIAEHNLALAYTQGLAVPRNFSLAAELFRRAAEQGYVPAMVNLAIFYQKGKGIAASQINSYAWYRAAAQRGDAEARTIAAALAQQFSPADKTLADTAATVVAERIHGAVRLPAPSPPQLADSAVAADAKPPPVLVSGLQSRSGESRAPEMTPLVDADLANTGSPTGAADPNKRVKRKSSVQPKTAVELKRPSS
jgi:TPR repeat protein